MAVGGSGTFDLPSKSRAFGDLGGTTSALNPPLPGLGPRPSQGHVYCAPAQNKGSRITDNTRPGRRVSGGKGRAGAGTLPSHPAPWSAARQDLQLLGGQRFLPSRLADNAPRRSPGRKGLGGGVTAPLPLRRFEARGEDFPRPVRLRLGGSSTGRPSRAGRPVGSRSWSESPKHDRKKAAFSGESGSRVSQDRTLGAGTRGFQIPEPLAGSWRASLGDKSKEHTKKNHRGAPEAGSGVARRFHFRGTLDSEHTQRGVVEDSWRRRDRHPERTARRRTLEGGRRFYFSSQSSTSEARGLATFRRLRRRQGEDIRVAKTASGRAK